MLLFSIRINWSRVDQEASTFIMFYTHYYMLSRKFYHICDDFSAFRLFNIMISLFLHLVLLLSFKEMRIQNLFKI